jgi:hypothetical protein
MKSFLNFHFLVKLNAKKDYLKFKKCSDHLKEIQLLKCQGDYEKFCNNNPLTTYEHYAEQFLQLRNGNSKIHFVPTSGSTNKIKWIPYNKKFKNELSHASGPWLFDLYTRYPEINYGKHFWSLSWIPNDLRISHHSDDLNVFSFFEKLVLSNTMALDSKVAFAPTLEEAFIESSLSLMVNKITLISVWSPTFLLEQLDIIFTHKDVIISKLKKLKKFENKIRILEKHFVLTSSFCNEMWPDLKMISSWDTGTSKSFADKLMKYFPGVQFQGKGLWATEGVVTIPFEDKFPLAYLSHFYEFEILDTSEIIPSWELKLGMKAKVIMTTASGLTRYRTGDVVLVESFFNSIPCLKFLGRDRVTDLVGEKISSETFSELINIIRSKFNANVLTFLAIKNPNPQYRVLIEDESLSLDTKRMEEIKLFCENFLLEFFHYRLAREAHQLLELDLLIKSNALGFYLTIVAKKIEIRGNIKVEPVIEVDEL